MLQYVDIPGRPAHLLGIVRDLTERKKSQEEIHHAAFHDILTGLPNRMMFNRELEGILQENAANNKKFALLFMDLDRFKFINDILGHVAGDELLQQAAQRLSRSIKKTDLVSRLGGDEFVVLLRNIETSNSIEFIAERIRRAFQEPFKFGEQEIYVNISIGISSFPKDGQSAEMLLKHADNALYRVKKKWRQ